MAVQFIFQLLEMIDLEIWKSWILLDAAHALIGGNSPAERSNIWSERPHRLAKLGFGKAYANYARVKRALRRTQVLPFQFPKVNEWTFRNDGEQRTKREAVELDRASLVIRFS